MELAPPVAFIVMTATLSHTMAQVSPRGGTVTIEGKIAATHGGWLEVESAGASRGSTFRLRLPARATAGA